MARKLAPYLVATIFGAAIALSLVAVGVLPIGAVSADSGSSLACVDRNGDGVIDKDEAIEVLTAFIFQTPISQPEPMPTPSGTPVQTPVPTATPTPTPTATPTPTPTPTPVPGDGTSRSKAWPYGHKFQAGILDMQITAVDTDAWPEIQAENQFNDPPAEGHRFVMWTMNVHNVRGSSEEYQEADRWDFDLVSNGVQYSAGDSYCGVIPNGYLDARLYRDGQTTGNLCFSVPTDDTDMTFLYDADQERANGDSFNVRVWFKALPE